MLKTILKILFAGALLFWLASSGKLDFSLIKKSFEAGPYWLITFILIVIQLLLGAYRYKLLLETKSKKKLNYFTILRLNYIGIFFSSVLPGAITGDFIKVVYIKKLDESISNSLLLTITLLDRIIGLMALLFLAGSFSLIFYSEVTALSGQIAHVITLNILLFSGSLLFLLILLSPEKFQNIFHHIFLKIPYIGKKISTLLSQIFSLRENKKDIFLALFISLMIQFLSIFSFWVISFPHLEHPLPLQYAFTFIPIGMVATAIPISPGGLGIGHVLYANLFSLVHINNGASLFNLFYLCTLTNNVLGVIPYLLIGRNQKKPKET